MSRDDARPNALVRRPSGGDAPLAVRPDPTQRGTRPPPRGPGAGPWTPPRTAAERGPAEFHGFEDFASFGEEPLAGSVGDDGAFGGSSMPGERAPAPGGGAPRFDLSRWRIRDEVLNRVPRDLVEAGPCIPLALEDEEEGPVLVLAVVDPGDPRAADAVAEHTGLPVRMVRAPRDAIWARIVEHYRA
jgi:hypothetical protein